MKLELDGATLSVEVDGPVDAPVILAWNGAMCTLRMWDLVVPMISDNFRMIRFDVRGIGESSAALDPETE